MTVATEPKLIITKTFNQIVETFQDGYRRLFLDGGTTSSKCLGKGTRIVMADLTLKVVEDVIVGDKLMGIDGKPRVVLKLYQGQDKLYKIKQARGIDYIVSSNHILSLRENWKEIRDCVRIDPALGKGRQKRRYVRNDHTYEVTNIPLPEYMEKSLKWKRRHKGWKLAGVELAYRKVSIEPYFVGMWLGDGTRANTNITNSDREVIDYLKWFAVRNYLIYHKIKHDKYGHSLVRTTESRKNPLREALRDYRIFEDKRIPKEYLNNSRQVRLELLAGLIDSDGYNTRRNTLAITQVREELARDILLLVRSLGFYATFNTYVAKMKRRDGTIYETDSYRVEFVGDNIGSIPVKLERKKVSNKPLPRRYVSSIEVEPAGFGAYYGFEIDGDHLFLLEDFTVTHNTYSTMQFLKFLLESWDEDPLLATVTSESMPHLKRGCIRDFINIMGKDLIEARWNKSDFIYTWANGCKLEFVSDDHPEKWTGGRRDIIFFNEMNNIHRLSYMEADMRTRMFTIGDWNPYGEFWFHDDKLAEPKENRYIGGLTFRDTPDIVSGSLIRTLERYKDTDPNYYRVHWLGLLGDIEGLVYPHFEQVDKLPEGDYFYGLDFGFAKDPTVLTKHVIIGDKLYSQEMFTNYDALTNDQIDREIDKCHVSRSSPIYPDPDEPKSAEELRNFDWNVIDAVKGKGSVSFGIQKVNEYYQHWTKDSLNCIKAQRNFRYIEDRDHKGRYTTNTTHQWSHCLIAGTLIRTKEGSIPIEQVKLGDYVLTGSGWQKVLASGMTSPNDIVQTVTFSNGSSITGTADHPVWVNGQGYIPLHALRYYDIMNVWEKESLLNTMEIPITAIPNRLIGQTKCTIGNLANALPRKQIVISIAKSGLTIMETSQKAMKSIIKMVMSLIIPLEILSVVPKIGTMFFIPLPCLSGNVNGLKLTSRNTSALQKRSGISGTVFSASYLGKVGNLKSIFASIVEKNIKLDNLTPKQDASVQTTASQPIVERQGKIILRQLVDGVASLFKRINIRMYDVAPVYVLNVSEPHKKRQPVFDLTVDESHNFYANGILVHNSMDSRRYAVASHRGMVQSYRTTVPRRRLVVRR